MQRAVACPGEARTRSRRLWCAAGGSLQAQPGTCKCMAGQVAGGRRLLQTSRLALPHHPQVRLFRPWSAEHMLAALPKSVKRIAVMDRTKEHGSGGEFMCPAFMCLLAWLWDGFRQRCAVGRLACLRGGLSITCTLLPLF